MKTDDTNWLLLIHNIPPKPAYLRVKIWRRLQKLGAVAIKNSVYVLPKSDAAIESFNWVMREINECKGDATICEANFIEGLNVHQIQTLFELARNADYDEITSESKKLLSSTSKKIKPDDPRRKELEERLAKLKKRLQDIFAIDFFSASGREGAEAGIREIDAKLNLVEPGSARIGKSSVPLSQLQKRTWVTRKGIHVDRMACSWLIKRFIDPQATLKFVEGKGYAPKPGEIRFDMFEAEFTHEGDNCSFEVLISKANLIDPALRPIAQIIHDIDLRDSKFSRQDTAGIEVAINGICLAHKGDDKRLERATCLFDDLYEYFKRKHK